MMVLTYSDEIAHEILKKFRQKGWNLYVSDGIEQTGHEGIIRQNFAESLEVDRRYVLLPTAVDPRDPKQVMGALEALAQKLDREMPTIQVENELYPFVGITLREDHVKLHTPEGTLISYHGFMKALNSIVQT